MMMFALLNIAGVLLGVMLTLFVTMFDDPRRVAGRKRGKR
jgi:hypothetical protein